MKKEQHTLWKEKEYAYPMAGGFTPFLVSYTHSGGSTRPGILVIPGGGYCFVAPSEAEPVAKRFYAEGYNAFVLTYTVNPLMNAPLHLQPLRDASRAMRFIRRNAGTTDPNRLAVCGFSAGGHLAASLAVHWQDIADPDEALNACSNRPNAAILSYPVITGGEYAHRGSFQALLGEPPRPDDLEYMCLEKQVGEHTPPCFLWQTAADNAVPVENSYLFAQACREQGVPYAHHVFAQGQHGLALADEAWLQGDYGDDFTTRQLALLRDKAKAGEIPGIAQNALEPFFAPPEDRGEAYRAQLEKDCRIARVWPDLAIAWLDSVWDQARLG